MAKSKTFIKIFAGLNYDLDPMDIRPTDSPLLNDVYSEPKGGLCSPFGSTKYSYTAYEDGVNGLVDFRYKGGQKVVIGIDNGSFIL